jgi:3',5'-cyclic AMP phosphodiesterase CpdA
MGAALSGPGAAKCSEDEFMSLFEQMGATALAKHLGTRERNVYSRRRDIENKRGITLSAPNRPGKSYPGRVPLEIVNGSVLIGSDLHIWPGEESTCLRAFKKFVDDLKPSAVILNGDVMDFPRISRHPQSWESAPDPKDEIEAAFDHLADIVARSKRGSRKIWTLGNHDARLEALIANSTPQLRGLKGVHLADHFDGVWEKAMSCFINGGTPHATMVKHRLAGGQHATYNNVKKAGTHIVTGHLHSQNIRSVTDYRDVDLYGVDTGCVADKEHKAFTYHEDSPVDWRSGFALLTYRDGRLMPPELATKWSDREVVFRGKIFKV